MNFKFTATKSIVSTFGPLILAMIAFNHKYCTTCSAIMLKAQQQKFAVIVLLGIFFITYIVWSILEQSEKPKVETNF